MNPFAAPEHDAPLPGEQAPNGILRMIGFIQMFCGALLVLGGTIGAAVLTSKPRTPDASGLDYLMALRCAVFLVGGAWCIAAGYTIRRGILRRTLWLQLGPVLLSAFFIIGQLRLHTGSKNAAQSGKSQSDRR